MHVLQARTVQHDKERSVMLQLGIGELMFHQGAGGAIAGSARETMHMRIPSRVKKRWAHSTGKVHELLKRCGRKTRTRCTLAVLLQYNVYNTVNCLGLCFGLRQTWLCFDLGEWAEPG